MSNPLKQTTMLTRHVPGYIWSARTVTWNSDAVRCVAVNCPTSGVAVPPVPPHSTKVHQPLGGQPVDPEQNSRLCLTRASACCCM